MKDITGKHLNTICEIFTKAESKDDIKSILLDLCTTKELEAIYQRFRVAKMLKAGWTFSQIEKATSISSTTITRVSKSLQSGSGYKKILNEFNIDNEDFE